MRRTDRCPLCHASAAAPVSAVPYEEIYRELARQWKVELSPAVAQRHAPSDDATLVRCDGCGLEYFQGAMAGDPEFYAELSAAFAYEQGRWEFERVARELSEQDSVVDLGAGTGVFLRSLEVASRVGVDHNAPAIEELRAQGIEGHAVPFDEFADQRRGAFSAVTAFHLIEHITDVADLIRPAVQLLRPGGRLFVSAPNAERARESDQLEPLDCPPHHVSRWRDTQWRSVAEEYGLHLVGVSYEPPPIIAYEHRIVEALAERGVGWASRPLLALLWRTGATRRGYERRLGTDWFVERSLYGHSMLAEFRI